MKKDTAKLPWEIPGNFGEHWYCNGKIINSQPFIPVNDTGWMRDFKVFEVMEAVITTPFHAEDHLERLWGSVREARIKLKENLTSPHSDLTQKILKIIRKLLKKNDFLASLVWIYVTGGSTRDGFTPLEDANVYIFISRKTGVPPESISLKTIEEKRELPNIKTTNYFVAERALMEAKKRGYDDVLYTDPISLGLAGHLALETSRKNLCIIQDEVLKTPKSGVLTGVTCSIVLELASEFKICEEIKIQDLRLGEVLSAEEVFTVSTTNGVLPVTKINETAFPIGNRTKELKKLFVDYREKYFRKRTKIRR